jgi:hypothetical protein
VQQPRLDELAQLRARVLVGDGAAEHPHQGFRLLAHALPGFEVGADHAFAEMLVGSLEHRVEALERRRGYRHDGREERVLGAEELRHLGRVHASVHGDASDGRPGETVAGEPCPGRVEPGPAPTADTRPRRSIVLRVSARHLDEALSTDDVPAHSFDRVEKLSAGEIVDIEINLVPIGLAFHPGEQVRLIISSRNLLGTLMAGIRAYVGANRGQHVIHPGGERASYLQLRLQAH